MQPFALERFFARHEFNVKHILSASDVEALNVQELLSLTDEETRTLWNNLKLSYTETLGHPQLLAEISRMYRHIDYRHLLVAAPEELIYIAFHVLLTKDDHVIVTAPAYQSLHEIGSHIGCHLDRWNLDRTQNGWELDLQYLRGRVTDKTRLIVINFPHNPTGHQISVEDQRQIMEIARKRGIWIFSDEMYRGAEYRNEDQLPAVADEYDRGISLWGLSKSFALPGLRLGWLASQNGEFLARCSEMRDYLTICNSAPGEILGIMALRARERILHRTKEIIGKNLASADAFFAQHTNEFQWLRPKAGSVAFPILRGDIPIKVYCQELIRTKSLLLTPGSLFQYEGNHFRIGLGRRDFGEAIELLSS